LTGPVPFRDDYLAMTHAALLSGPLLRRAQRLRRNAASLPRHEYCGIVEEVGSDVTTIRPGQFIIGSFFASDNTCPHCRAGYQTSCQHREYVGAGGAQVEALRVPLADGTLVATPEVPDDGLLASLLAASDVLGTGWFAAVNVELTIADLDEIEAAAAGIQIQGARYPEHLERLTGQ
jgi:threonine dehydrogenase-like Zn-dependent dehydrogenase